MDLYSSPRSGGGSTDGVSGASASGSVNGVNGVNSTGEASRGRRTQVQCQQHARREAVDGRVRRAAGRPWSASRHASPAGSRTATPGTWVTYYGLHQPVGTPRSRKDHRDGQDRQGDVAACALHCAFANTRLVSEAGFLDEARVVKRLEDSVPELRPRVAAMRDAHNCFARLGSASDVDDDPCFYTMKFAKCMDMGILKEFNKIKYDINL
ncbi:uncharacterized protein LOC113212492 [Frankliniella occidentalis]|uniref:Uncharacterized protein LOC113212492 n=1 Tax=Frankliniella occidentalis TaxID=133901 RepID=A0A6J1T185_FRAOC|nr:uncharacterized protein LOC113212492 [Frankliniella occidentalis]